jgi:hypothetical protein
MHRLMEHDITTYEKSELQCVRGRSLLAEITAAAPVTPRLLAASAAANAQLVALPGQHFPPSVYTLLSEGSKQYIAAAGKADRRRRRRARNAGAGASAVAPRETAPGAAAAPSAGPAVEAPTVAVYTGGELMAKNGWPSRGGSHCLSWPCRSLQRSRTAGPPRHREQPDNASARAATHDTPITYQLAPPRIRTWRPPFVLESRHEVSTFLESGHEVFDTRHVDWAVSPANWGIEKSQRIARSELLKKKLQSGTPVCYRSSGWSMYPLVHSNDKTTYEPVTDADQVQENDIVFCQVQPGDRFYAHLVKRKWLSQLDGQLYYTIANYKGHEKGWCLIEHLYGRLVECLR